MPNKICSRCKEEKPLDYFHGNRRKPLGKESRCKNCRNSDPLKKEIDKRWYEKNKEEICRKKKIYTAKNKEEITRKSKIYYAKNKEPGAARNKAYREKHREKLSAYTREWRKQNPDYKKNPQQRAYNKEYEYKRYHCSKGRFRAYKTEAKARNYNFNLTFEQFESFWQKPCTYCGSHIKEIGLDRINNEQGYNIENVTPCCWLCNSRKRAMPLQEWIDWLDRLSERYMLIKEGIS